MEFERERRQFACLIMYSLTWMLTEDDYDYNELELADKCDDVAQKHTFRMEGDLIDTECAYEDADAYAKEIFNNYVKEI